MKRRKRVEAWVVVLKKSDRILAFDSRREAVFNGWEPHAPITHLIEVDPLQKAKKRLL